MLKGITTNNVIPGEKFKFKETQGIFWQAQNLFQLGWQFSNIYTWKLINLSLWNLSILANMTHCYKHQFYGSTNTCGEETNQK